MAIKKKKKQDYAKNTSTKELKITTVQPLVKNTLTVMKSHLYRGFLVSLLDTEDFALKTLKLRT